MGEGGVERVKRTVIGVAAVALLALAAGASSASGEALSPWWVVSTGSEPTSLVSGQHGTIVVTAENRGDASTSGEVTIADELPAGLAAKAIEGVAGTSNGSGNRGPVSCVRETLTCTFSGSLRPYEQIEVRISVRVEAGARGENTVTVSGGGAASAASASRAIEVDGSERFGVEDFEVVAENAGGSVDTQAGSHPFQLTSVIALNTTTPEPGRGPRTVALAKDLASELPAGLIADPAPIARCSEAQFNVRTEEGNECPAQSAVGVATLTVNEPLTVGLDTVTAPIFNLQPLPGEPARFGIKALGLLAAYLETSLRSGGDYGVTLAAENITQTVSLLGMKLTFWGAPGDPRHDGQRGWECLDASGACAPAAEAATPAFLSLPTSCAGELQARLEGDSWQQNFEQPGRLYPLASYTMGRLDGCSLLSFDPRIEAVPEARQASSPSGFDIDVRVPQESGENPEEVAGSAVRDITLQLPEGVELNPAVADGLAACSQALIGFEGFMQLDPESEPGAQTPMFSGTLPEPLEPGVNFCPNESKLGTVRIATPLLAGPLEGWVYLASPQSLRAGPSENPFRSLLAVYVVAREPASGVFVELAGRLTPNPATGQLTASFEQTPQLPLQEIDLDFFGGERAPLSTPARCGSYTTQAAFVPWAATLPGGISSSSDLAAVTVHASATFQIDSGPNGGPCPGTSLPFAPSLTAQTTSVEAGAFTPLTASVGREDGQQAIESVRLKLPPGVAGVLAGVKPCGEAQANAGSCGPESEIGATTFSVGLGGDPYTISGGRVYLTEKYEGAPFGLALVTPARVGPFALEEGRPIVVRAKLEIDPATAALTIAIGAGAGGIPNIIEGIPLQLKHLNIAIDRPGFIFNPTSCDPTEIESTIGGSEGASATVPVPFQIADCANLKFGPKLSASTEAHAEALKGGAGASLNVKIASRVGAGVSGEEANIKRIDITLPRLLPARLQPTLQNACTEARFAKDPADCPPDSFVGTATALTPLLDVGLSGPAIFVSRGGAAPPDLDLVLQGEGVEILLTGHTDIKGGVTSSRFETVPDAPISAFDLTLPEGPHSALASGLPTNEHSLCGQILEMPTTIEGHNGAVVKQDTRVRIEGCKAALYIRSSRVSGRSVTLTVTVPSAGRIVASGVGLSGQTKHPGGEKLVTLKLTLTRTQAAKVSKRHGLKRKVKLVFTPERGRKLTKSLAVSFG